MKNHLRSAIGWVVRSMRGDLRACGHILARGLSWVARLGSRCIGGLLRTPKGEREPLFFPELLPGLLFVGCGVFILGVPFLARGQGEADALRAELFSSRHTTLSSELSARIIDFSAGEGERFKKGQVLVTFDCKGHESRLARARAELTAARAKADINSRLSSLHAASELDVRLTRAEVDMAKAEVAVQESVVAQCTIVAPYAGKVVEQMVRAHQFVKAGEPLLAIQGEESLEVRFLMPSKWLSRLDVGDPFEVFIEETEKRYPATIHAFGARIDAVSRMVRVLGKIDGSYEDILPGMSGTVTIPALSRRGL